MSATPYTSMQGVRADRLRLAKYTGLLARWARLHGVAAREPKEDEETHNLAAFEAHLQTQAKEHHEHR